MKHYLPVSYTHLDVYKRQVTGVAAFAKFGIKKLIAKIAIKNIMNFIVLFIFSPPLNVFLPFFLLIIYKFSN